VILARLLEWEQDEVAVPAPNGTHPSPMALDEMATILSASGYLVREGQLEEAAWQRIGQQAGYVQEPAVEKEASLDVRTMRIRAFGVDNQWLHPVVSLRTAPSATELGQLTILDYCRMVDITRHGVAVDPEIRELLGEKGLRAEALYADHAATLARYWPCRWPDTTQGGQVCTDSEALPPGGQS
jgi:hypothetical protein